MTGKPQGSVGRDRAPAVDDIVDAYRRYVEFTGQPILTDSERAHEFFKQDLAWGDEFNKLIQFVHAATLFDQ